MTTNSISNLIGKRFHMYLYRNLHIWTIEKTKYLKQLTKIQVNKILDKMKIDKVKAGTTIFRKGQYKDERLLLLIEGTIVKVRTLGFLTLIYFTRNQIPTKFYYANTAYGELSNSWTSQK